MKQKHKEVKRMLEAAPDESLAEARQDFAKHIDQCSIYSLPVQPGHR